MNDNGSPLVSVRGIKTYFTVRTGIRRTVTVKAVDGVSLEIGRGETVALVGESGSGKTTLGRTILRLADPAAGSIVFDGKDVLGMDRTALKAYRRRVQAIFQDPYSSVSPYMRVSEIVEEPLVIHGVHDRSERERRVMRALEQVRLTPSGEIAGKFPHNLSGGQRQRICVARAIVLEPDFIVADEPVSMVDASIRTDLLNLLKELQTERGIAFLYISHDIASARHFSDRIAVMYLGTLVESGSPGQVIDNPLHPYTKGLLASVPEPDPENRNRLREVIPGEPPDASKVPTGCPFHPRCPSAMKGKCDIERPRIEEIEPGHGTACWLYGG